MLVKRTAMNEQLRFFFTMFSTSVVSKYRDSIFYQILQDKHI
jgi:hypothetical protein